MLLQYSVYIVTLLHHVSTCIIILYVYVSCAPSRIQNPDRHVHLLKFPTFHFPTQKIIDTSTSIAAFLYNLYKRDNPCRHVHLLKTSHLTMILETIEKIKYILDRTRKTRIR